MIEAGRDPLYLQSQPTGARTLSVAIDAFLDDCKERNLRESTIDSYTKTLSYLNGTAPLDAVDAEFLGVHRKTREIAASTWRKELETLRALFSWCIERKWISDNPAKRLRMPRVEDLSTLPFAAEEVERLLHASDQISSDDPAETPYIRKRARPWCWFSFIAGSGFPMWPSSADRHSKAPAIWC